MADAGVNTVDDLKGWMKGRGFADGQLFGGSAVSYSAAPNASQSYSLSAVNRG